MGHAGLRGADKLILAVPVNPVAAGISLAVEGLAGEHVQIGKFRHIGGFVGPAVCAGPDEAGGCGLTAQAGAGQPQGGCLGVQGHLAEFDLHRMPGQAGAVQTCREHDVRSVGGQMGAVAVQCHIGGGGCGDAVNLIRQAAGAEIKEEDGLRFRLGHRRTPRGRQRGNGFLLGLGVGAPAEDVDEKLGSCGGETHVGSGVILQFPVDFIDCTHQCGFVLGFQSQGVTQIWSTTSL